MFVLVRGGFVFGRFSVERFRVYGGEDVDLSGFFDYLRFGRVRF